MICKPAGRDIAKIVSSEPALASEETFFASVVRCLRRRSMEVTEIWYNCTRAVTDRNGEYYSYSRMHHNVNGCYGFVTVVHGPEGPLPYLQR